MSYLTTLWRSQKRLFTTKAVEVSDKRIGWIGTGVMGKHMVSHL